MKQEHSEVPLWMVIVMTPAIIVGAGIDKAKELARKIRGKK